MFEYRCLCGHFEDEHTVAGGCAGCDAAGMEIKVIEHDYIADFDWPEPSSPDCESDYCVDPGNCQKHD